MLCKEYQRRAEDEIRFQDYAEQIPDNKVSVLSEDWVRHIKKKSAPKKRSRLSDEEIGWQRQMTEKILNTVRAEYVREMKKCMVLSEMKDKKTHKKFNDLRINLRKETHQVNYYGTIRKLDYERSFIKLQGDLALNHTTRDSKLVEMLESYIKQDKKVDKELLKINIPLTDLPMKLNMFIDIEQTELDKKLNSLHIRWRDAFVQQISDKLREMEKEREKKTFDNREVFDDFKADSQTPLRRFLTRFDIIFRDSVRELAESNVRWLLDLLKSFVMPKMDDQEDEIWEVSSKPLLILSIKPREKTKEEKDKEKKERREGKKKRSKTVNKNLIFFDPAPEDIREKISSMVDWLIKSINSMKNLDSDILNLLNLPSRSIYPVDKDTPLFKEAFEKIEEYMDRGFDRPNAILEKFKEYSFLLQSTPDELVSEFLHRDKDRKKKKKSVRELDEYLNKVNQSIKDIQGLCINEKNTHFFQVRTRDIKDKLTRKAEKIIKELTSKISQMTVKKVSSIQNKYDNLIDEVKKKIEDEQQLVKIQNITENFDKNLEEFENEENEVAEYINLLTKYNAPYEDKEVVRFWFLKVKPNEVRSEMRTASSTVSRKERELLDKLAEDKVEFIDKLKELHLKFKEICEIEGYQTWKDRENEIVDLNTEVNKVSALRKRLQNREELIGDRISQFESLDELITMNKPYQNLRIFWRDFEDSKGRWLDRALMTVNYHEVRDKIKKTNEELNKLKASFEPEDNSQLIIREILKEVDEFRVYAPLIEELTREAIVKTSNYWKEIFDAINVTPEKKETVQLQTLISKLNLMDHFKTIRQICMTAEEEYNLKKRFKTDIELVLNEKKVDLIPYKKTDIMILEKVDELQEIYDEKFNMLIVMNQNPFVRSIKTEVVQIKNKLISYQDMFDSWMRCQRDWMYLEPIFSSKEIINELPDGKKLFDEVNEKWVDLMNKISEDRQIFTYQDSEQMANSLNNNNEKLAQINKMLNKYLENKRSDFPRFYFLSDDELLEILSRAKNPKAVRKYMNKCFEAIESIDFNNKLEVVSMSSKEKDTIPFNMPVITSESGREGHVEIWLGDLEQQMRDTLMKKTTDCIQDTERPRTEWVLHWPGQIIIAVNNIKWTETSQEAILQGTLQQHYDKLIKERDEIVELVKGDRAPLERLTLGALIVIDQHAIYVIENLINEGISSLEDFDWVSQLRYYLEPISRRDKTMIVKTRMITSELEYQYEYLGNSARLVITPLTDRCYRTLMGAYNCFYGGAPEGPAGTGKTETVKDLAKAVAVQCVVFNCSDQINYVAMSKFFKGLSQCGAWCCFDEFNRIEQDVLSVIAEQVRTIQTAIKESRTEFHFEGILCPLKKSAFTCITMNPGYAGRSELPDNLKALFRPCAMMVPDYSLIAEIVLFSYGFSHAQMLAKKVVASLQLSSEQLSTQKHYDFGMRALKAILVAAGNLKKEFPTVEENKLCLKALLDVNIPKFTQNDIPLFNSITSDLFPGVETIETDFSLLENTLIAVSKERQLIEAEVFILKCLQLYRTLLVRHGLMLVGDTFSGKSSVINVLQASLTALHGQQEFIKTEKYLLNPKAVTSPQLYGNLDSLTKQWTDGILPKIMINCENEFSNDEEQGIIRRRWIVFDGPVDAVWIENMNTVLDDNKILCLTNGQKIKVTPRMNLMFEVENLNYASPATVSRCGMVFLQPEQLGWEPLLDAYIKYKLPEVLKPMAKWIRTKMDWLLTPTLIYAQKNGRFPFKIDEMQMVQSTIKIFDSMASFFILKSKGGENGAKGDQHQSSDIAALMLAPKGGVEGETFVFKDAPFSGKEGEALVNNFALFSVFWGIGVVLEEQSRKDFHQFIMKLIYFEDVEKIYKLIIDKEWTPNKLTTSLNDEIDSLYNYVYDLKSIGWMKWTKTVPTWKPTKDEKMQYSSLIIPTSDTIRNSFFMKLMVDNHHHMLFTGPTGTAKTISAVSEIRKSYNNSEFANIQTVFSGQTLANQVQLMIDAKMNSRRGGKGHFGPEDNKPRMLIFIDDINMPQKEIYNAQPPIELLRMWSDHGFWYDLEEMDKRFLHDMTFVTTMGPPSLGRNMITRRYLRHFFIMYTEAFSQSSLETIFESILDWYFLNVRGQLPNSIIGLKNPIIKATIRVYEEVIANLLPTPSKSHYLYNLRDISRVFQGITKAQLRSFSDSNDFIKLWAHECTRVFMDRLTSKEDINLFQENILKKVMAENLNKKWSSLVKHEPLLWADFIPTIYPNGDKKKPPMTDIYCELTERENLQSYSEQLLEQYNKEMDSQLNLVLFSNAIEHLVRIVRVIKTPNGHSFLVGVGGSGKRSLAKLSTFIAKYEIFNIEITKKYDYNKEWVEDLIDMFKNCGIEDQKTVFLFSDNQIFADEVLEDLSSILNQGERQNLFPFKEKALIIDDISDRYEDEVEDMSSTEKFDFFIKKCKENLHLVLTFSPVGSTFRQRLRTFPSLINCTTIDWFLPWPKSALDQVARTLLKDCELEKVRTKQIADIFVRMHSDVTASSLRYLQEMKKYFYVTPKTYLELLNGFVSNLKQNLTYSQDQIKMYENGLQKLKDAESEVGVKEIELKELKPKLAQSQKDTNALIERVKEEQKVASVTKQACEAERVRCIEVRQKATTLAAECKEEVDKLQPILDNAVYALDSVERKDIDEIGANKNPKLAIKQLFEAFCIIWGFKEGKGVKMIKDPNNDFAKIPDYFGCARLKIFNNSIGMLKKLQSYKEKEINEMNPAIISRIKKMVNDTTGVYKEFNSERLKKISICAQSLFIWIECILDVNRGLVEINPRREAKEEAEERLSTAESQLKSSEANLKEAEDRMAKLQAELQTAKDNKAQLERDVSICQKHMSAAIDLLDGLESERGQWEIRKKKLREDSVNILGDTVLSTGIIAYLGALPKDYRETLIADWKALLAKGDFQLDPEFTLQKVCCDQLTIGNWVDKYSLPNDKVSIDNAIIMTKSNRYPLIIDPQEQANRWIRKLYERYNLQVFKANAEANKISIFISEAIQAGYPFLIGDVTETISSMVESILDKDIQEVAGMTKIRFMDKTVNYNPNFQIFLTTKLGNPHYPPETCAKVTLLNFQVTPEGLEDQLVNLLVSIEHTADSNKWQNSIKKFYDCKERQDKAAKDILQSLNNQDENTNILDDDELISTLKSSQKTSVEAKSTLQDIARIREKMKKLKANLQDCGFRMSALFFCVTDMADVEPMYQFSLDWYVELATKAIEKDKGVKSKENRTEKIVTTFLELLFKQVSRSLFEKDKMLFSFLIFLKVLQCNGTTSQEEIRKLLLNIAGKPAVKPNPASDWLSTKQWDQICDLSKFSTVFQGLDIDFEENPDQWKAIYESLEPQEENYPNNWKHKLSAVQSIIVLKVLRPDKLIPSIKNAIGAQLGPHFVEWEVGDLDSVFEDAGPFSPIIFILSTGSDPLDQIFKLAEKFQFECNIISLGQGQERAAGNAIEKAKKEGSWIVLQNCHLAPAYLTNVEKSLGEKEGVNNRYKMILTSVPTPKFPVSILQQGVKITDEPPRGLKANLLKTYYSFDKSFETIKSKKHEWKKLVFGLSFFHALILERRKFGSLGWNIPYQFSQMDMAISLSQIRIFLEDYEEIPWKALHYMIAEANYGGRVTDPKDRRLIKVMLCTFFTDEILEDGYSFLEGDTTYYAPQEGAIDSYKEYIKSLPAIDDPKIFGLHDNANITSGINDANELLDSVLELQPTANSSGGVSSDELITDQCTQILADLPEEFDLEIILRAYPIDYSESMNTVLQQECMRFNGLTSTIKRTLAQLKKAIAGTVIMNKELEEVYQKLLVFKVPNTWHRVSYPSLKPLTSWVADYKLRIEFIQNWIDNGKPISYWISGFFFTQSFLTGTLQNYARRVRLILLLFHYINLLEQKRDRHNQIRLRSYLRHGS